MAITSFVLGTYLSVDSPKGFVNLYGSLASNNTSIDTSSYINSIKNSDGENFGQIIGWRRPNVLKVRLKKPIVKQKTNYGSMGTSGVVTTSYKDVWLDASQVSLYAPPLDEKALKFYYSTGNSVRLRSSPSLLNLNNVIGSANKGALLGKSDGYLDGNFVVVYATTLNGNFKIDKSGKRVKYYVHKDYVTTVNPAGSSNSDSNAPTEGNAAPSVTDTSDSSSGGMSFTKALLYGLGIMAIVALASNFIKKRKKQPNELVSKSTKGR